MDTALANVMADFKAKAAAVTTPSQMWALEDYLRERRKDIDGTFDYRYSQLTGVFAQLIQDGHLEEAWLDGLAEEKRAGIRQYLQFLRDDRS